MSNHKVKNWQWIILGIIIAFSLFLKIYYNYHWPKAKVKINARVFNVLVADNKKNWIKGLGGRDNLGNYDGMIFLFPTQQQHVFVMRDMRFPIDIIWIKNGVVVDFAPNVPLDLAKTESELVPYAARDVSDRVLELKAGTAQQLNLKIGDKVDILR
jgi:uncharacterized membrane protein (UPF0127 family)